tara:strand:- start:211 stop:492 length:282 start_codon:yes stop_codon:yes gene_type:complete
VSVDTIVIETTIVLLALMMSVLDAVALTVKRPQSQHQDSNMDEFNYAGSERIFDGDDIYECLACGKMYTSEAMYIHEGVCDKVEEYLKSKEDQ